MPGFRSDAVKPPAVLPELTHSHVPMSGCVYTCSLAKEAAAFPLVLPVLVRVKLSVLLDTLVAPNA